MKVCIFTSYFECKIKEMKSQTVLIAAGYKGSGPHHWQTWLEGKLPSVVRVTQEWDKPIISVWAMNIRKAIDQAPGAVWIVAHSFGCLASVIAAVDRRDKVAGLMLVAPADPDRFTPVGISSHIDCECLIQSIEVVLPKSLLGIPCLFIASTDDPWLTHSKAKLMSEWWGSKLVTLDGVGHINTESGFGAWPKGLELFNELRKMHEMMPLGEICIEHADTGKSTHSRQLAKARHVMRRALRL